MKSSVDELLARIRELLALIRKGYQKENVLFFEECISEWAYEAVQEEFESREELEQVIKVCVEVDKTLQEVL